MLKSGRTRVAGLKVEENEATASSLGSASVSLAVSRILRGAFSMSGRALRPRSAESFGMIYREGGGRVMGYLLFVIGEEEEG